MSENLHPKVYSPVHFTSGLLIHTVMACFQYLTREVSRVRFSRLLQDLLASTELTGQCPSVM